MSENKLQIEINNHSYDNDAIYVAVGLKGGFITKRFLVDYEPFTSNYTFFNVLFNYYRFSDLSDINFDVLRASSIMSFKTSSNGLIQTLNQTLITLFKHEFKEEIFERAKQISRDSFEKNYKDGNFRAKYKGFEFSDLNKHFLLKELIFDIENIDFETFKSIATTLLSPANVCVYICGDTSHIDWNEIQVAIPSFNSPKVDVAGYNFDPYLKQDAHIVNIARENSNIVIETIDFLNTDITNFTKLLIIEVLAEQLPNNEADIWVDSLDASIIITSEQLESCKGYIKEFHSDDFEKNKNSLISKYIVLLEKHPDIFSVRSVNMMLIGVYINQYLEFLSSCSKDVFAEMCNTANIKITEAQIALRKGK